MYLTFICVLALVILTIQGFMLWRIAALRTLIVEVLLEDYQEDIFSDELDTLSEAELALSEYVEERNRAFDERISRLKDELAGTQTPSQQHTVADELHPLVKNLPHDSVQTYETNPPDVEYAD